MSFVVTVSVSERFGVGVTLVVHPVSRMVTTMSNQRWLWLYTGAPPRDKDRGLQPQQPTTSSHGGAYRSTSLIPEACYENRTMPVAVVNTSMLSSCYGFNRPSRVARGFFPA